MFAYINNCVQAEDMHASFLFMGDINNCVQAEDVHASFLFMSDLDGHHQEWMCSTTTNRHGVTALDLATVSGCDQLVMGATHPHRGTLDLLMTDVPDLVQVTVVASLHNSDHSSLSTAISMAQLFLACVLEGMHF